MQDAERSRCLVVLLHAYAHAPASLDAVEHAVGGALAEFEITTFKPHLPLSIFSTADASKIASDLADEIDHIHHAAIRDGRPFARIVLIGHSLGSLLARKLYVIACGETDEAPFEAGIAKTGARPWAGLVERIVLLAGMNRGWRVSHHLRPLQAPIWWLGTVIGRLIEIVTGRRVLILSVRVGAEFITNLRVQWLRMRQAAERRGSAVGAATTIQLLGSVDDMVSPRDNVDLVAGRDFLYLDVPFTGHADIVDLDDATPLPDGAQTRGALRRAIIVQAVAATPEQLKADQIIPDDLDALMTSHDQVETVVFVIHGIRDNGYWTHKIARAIRKRAGADAPRIATETSSYGYFPMLGFLFARERHRKVEWLMDQYAAAIARYPNARTFHFVGHSNGTYCLVDALRRYPACRFDNVVLAGSVARSRLDWRRHLRATQTPEQSRRHGRVDRVLNFVATGDWVVAAFPRLFETWLPIQQLGGAGHMGFKVAPPGLVSNVRYVQGDHGAGIEEPLWPAIADFVLTGEVGAIPTRPRRSVVVWLLGMFPPLAWILLLLLAGGIGLLLFRGATVTGACLGAPGLPAVAVTLYLLGLIRLLRWV